MWPKTSALGAFSGRSDGTCWPRLPRACPAQLAGGEISLSVPSDRTTSTGFPMVSGIWRIDSGLSGAAKSRLRFLLGIRGYGAAYATADANLHALSGHHRNALHQVRRADAAGPDRAAPAGARPADLPLQPLRFRREFSDGPISPALPAKQRLELGSDQALQSRFQPRSTVGPTRDQRRADQASLNIDKARYPAAGRH